LTPATYSRGISAFCNQMVNLYPWSGMQGVPWNFVCQCLIFFFCSKYIVHYGEMTRQVRFKHLDTINGGTLGCNSNDRSGRQEEGFVLIGLCIFNNVITIFFVFLVVALCIQEVKMLAFFLTYMAQTLKSVSATWTCVFDLPRSLWRFYFL
jgi:hypothetical protein